MTLAPFALVYPEDQERVAAQYGALAAGDLTLEYRFLHADGHSVWAHVQATLVRDGDGEPVHVLAQVQDVSERRRFEDRLQHLADHDPLTGLFNRRRFEQALDAQVALIAATGRRRAAGPRPRPLQVRQRHPRPRAGDELIVTRRRRCCASACVRPTCWRGSAATSSPCCCPARTRAGRAGGRGPRRRRPRRAAVVSAGSSRATHRQRRRRDVRRRRPHRRGVLVNADLAMYDAKEAGQDRSPSIAPRRRADADRGADSPGRADPPRAGGGPLRPARAADPRPRARRDHAVRAAAAHARRARRADPARRVPATSPSASA